jgi:hypothetical protein
MVMEYSTLPLRNFLGYLRSLHLTGTRPLPTSRQPTNTTIFHVYSRMLLKMLLTREGWPPAADRLGDNARREIVATASLRLDVSRLRILGRFKQDFLTCRGDTQRPEDRETKPMVVKPQKQLNHRVL